MSPKQGFDNAHMGKQLGLQPMHEYELAQKMCAGVLSVYMNVKMAALHGCCLSWSPARFYGKQTGCTQDMSKMVLGDYSKEEPGQRSVAVLCVPCQLQGVTWGILPNLGGSQEVSPPTVNLIHTPQSPCFQKCPSCTEA